MKEYIITYLDNDIGKEVDRWAIANSLEEVIINNQLYYPILNIREVKIKF